METKYIQVEDATAEKLAAFGDVVAVTPDMTNLPSPFYDNKVRIFKPATFTIDDDGEVAVTVIDRRPFQVRWMERHYKHTQMFIPLAGRPFVAIMAPPNDDDLPDLDQARAFLFDGSAGFAMHIGTWHEFPFPLIDGTQLVVVLRKEATDRTETIRDTVRKEEVEVEQLAGGTTTATTETVATPLTPKV